MVYLYFGWQVSRSLVSKTLWNKPHKHAQSEIIHVSKFVFNDSAQNHSSKKTNWPKPVKIGKPFCTILFWSNVSNITIASSKKHFTISSNISMRIHQSVVIRISDHIVVSVHRIVSANCRARCAAAPGRRCLRYPVRGPELWSRALVRSLLRSWGTEPNTSTMGPKYIFSFWIFISLQVYKIFSRNLRSFILHCFLFWLVKFCAVLQQNYLDCAKIIKLGYLSTYGQEIPFWSRHTLV